jgi:dTDP-4-dehydrorhamnose reductase
MKIVIPGANGMLGKYFCLFLSKKYNVIPITRQDIDLYKTNSNNIKKFFTDIISKDDVILNAAGIIKQRIFDIQEMIKVNSVFPHVLNDIKTSTGCNIIHITTDCVFSGNKGNYVETDKHDCLDEYGKTKSLGENNNNCNIRTSIIGEELYNKKSLIEWVKNNQNKEITGYMNHFWNGVTCLELAKFIDENILQSKNFWSGTRHIYSPNTVSKYELVNLINDVYNLNIKIIETNTEEKCCRNLFSIYNTNNVAKTLQEQLIELKNFSII